MATGTIYDGGVPRISFEAPAGLGGASSIRVSRDSAQVWSGVSQLAFDTAVKVQQNEAEKVKRQASEQGITDYVQGNADIGNLPTADTIRGAAYRSAALNGAAIDLDVETQSTFGKILAENPYDPELISRQTEAFVRGKQEALVQKAPDLVERFTLSAGSLRGRMISTAQGNLIERQRDEAKARVKIVQQAYAPMAADALARGDETLYQETLAKMSTALSDAVTMNAYTPSEAAELALVGERKIRSQALTLQGLRGNDPVGFVAKLPELAGKNGLDADDVVEITNKTISYASQQTSLKEQQRARDERAMRLQAGADFLDLKAKADAHQLTTDDIRAYGDKYKGSFDISSDVTSLFSAKSQASQTSDLATLSQTYKGVSDRSVSVDTIIAQHNAGLLSTSDARDMVEMLTNADKNNVVDSAQYKVFKQNLSTVFPATDGQAIPGLPKWMQNVDEQATQMRKQVELEAQRRLLEKPDDIGSINEWGQEIINRVAGPRYMQQQMSALRSQANGILGGVDVFNSRYDWPRVQELIVQRYANDDRQAAQKLREMELITNRYNQLRDAQIKVNESKKVSDGQPGN